MHAPLLITALLLFASMFMPLPSPVGLALSLWAIGAGVPLPAVLALYVLQDVLTYTALSRLLSAIRARFSGRQNTFLNHLPAALRGPMSTLLSPTGVGGGGLFSAALISFYAGAVLGVLRESSPLRSAAIVIGTDVARFVNGLAVALGAAFLLPSSPYSLLAASLLGFAVVAMFRLVPSRRGPSSALIPFIPISSH